MWEDTDHVKKETGNYVTWSQTEAYCSSLSLGGYNTWRLPRLVMESDGYTIQSNELFSLRVEPVNEGDPTTILNGFKPMSSSDGLFVWTSHQVDEGLYTAVSFLRGFYDAEGFYDNQNDVDMNVRCVRDRFKIVDPSGNPYYLGGQFIETG